MRHAISIVLVAVTVSAALLAAGCGGEVAPDLFEVLRGGQGAGAGVDLVVSDDGFVRCNHGPKRMITGDELLSARALQSALDSDARRHRRLAARPGGEFTYVLRMQDGTVSWADSSLGLRSPYQQAAELTHQLATTVCGLAA